MVLPGCANCRWWDQDQEQQVFDDDWDDMSWWRPTGRFLCTLFSRKNGEPLSEDVPADSVAVCMDASEYRASFYTKPEFRCSEWKPIELGK